MNTPVIPEPTPAATTITFNLDLSPSSYQISLTLCKPGAVLPVIYVLLLIAAWVGKCQNHASLDKSPHRD